MELEVKVKGVEDGEEKNDCSVIFRKNTQTLSSSVDSFSFLVLYFCTQPMRQMLLGICH